MGDATWLHVGPIWAVPDEYIVKGSSPIGKQNILQKTFGLHDTKIEEHGI